MNPNVPELVGTRFTHYKQQATSNMNSTVSISRTSMLEIFKAMGATLGYTPESLVMLEPQAGPIAQLAKDVNRDADKPKANMGRQTLWGAWSLAVMESHAPTINDKSEEFKGFVAKRVAAAEAGELVYTADMQKVKSGKRVVGDKMTVEEALVGVHIPFASFWRKEHPEQYSGFKAEWERKNPKAVAKAVEAVAPVEVVEAVAPVEVKPTKKRGPKKLAEMTPEELAIHEARKAERKAKKESVIPELPASPKRE